MNKNRGLTPLAAVLMLSGSIMLTGCDNKEAQQAGQQKPPEVGVVTLKNAPLQITTDLPGRTSSFRIAEVRPQVSGIILKRNFVEGSDIKAGQSLYQIDPATYQAAYDSAKGDLAQAVANAQIAAVTVKRYQPLLGTKYISQQDYDTAKATESQTAAAVQAAKANVETARINLAYTKVTSLSVVALVNLPSRKVHWFRARKPPHWLPCNSLILSMWTSHSRVKTLCACVMN